MATRLLVERSVEIVGAVGRSPEKVGRDLGEVTGLGRAIGVPIEADADTVLGRGADIAVVCVGSYLKTMHPHFEVCLANKVNVVTIEEETIFPWSTSPDLSASLDGLAKANGVTLAASGAQDVFWVNLVTTLLGASHRVDSVTGYCCWNVDDYGPEVAGHLLVGQSKKYFDQFVSEHGWPEFVARQTVEAMVSQLGLTPKATRSDVEPVVAKEAVRCQSLGREIAPGEIIGTVDRTRLSTIEGPEFEFRMEGRVYRANEGDQNHWQVSGEPALQLSNEGVPYRFTTCSTVVNRIPDVISAEPGLFSLDRLGPAQYRHCASLA
ncbi:dihydrodipicolinate reductase [Rhodobacterales bacterium HKCCSP123]|nr:dihydrodipicolinate reductase [Rhodobacterales bacterium HKCCSP123]